TTERYWIRTSRCGAPLIFIVWTDRFVGNSRYNAYLYQHNQDSPTMIKAVLIDDEPLARSMVAEYLESYPQIHLVAECNDGFEGAKAIMQLQPDLIFLDIQMPKINGFEMLEIIDRQPAVIFTTAFDEYAIRAFEQHAVDYLLKPITKSRF